MILAMLGVAFDASDATAPDRWRRYLALLLDGLRGPADSPLPAPAPVFTTLDDMVAVGKRPRRAAPARALTGREAPRGRRLPKPSHRPGRIRSGGSTIDLSAGVTLGSISDIARQRKRWRAIPFVGASSRRTGQRSPTML